MPRGFLTISLRLVFATGLGALPPVLQLILNLSLLLGLVALPSIPRGQRPLGLVANTTNTIGITHDFYFHHTWFANSYSSGEFSLW